MITEQDYVWFVKDQAELYVTIFIKTGKWEPHMAKLIVRKGFNLIDPEIGAAAKAQNANWRKVGNNLEQFQTDITQAQTNVASLQTGIVSLQTSVANILSRLEEERRYVFMLSGN